VHIEGSLRTRSWEDKDKNKRFMTEIIASNLVMLDKRTSEFRHDNDDNNGLNTTTDLTDSDDEVGSELPY
jgi:single-strand DNA-binding protein